MTTQEQKTQTLYLDTEKSGIDYIDDYANLPGVQGPLWGGHKIPVLGVCGEIGQGKTTFLLDIACGPVSYVDLPAQMVATHTNGWKPIDVYLKFLAIIRAVPVGRFRVIALDVSEEIESGIADWVWQNPLYFNHTAGQYMKMNAIYQADVSALCKMLFGEIASKCETFAFANHMGLVFKGGEPTGEKKNKGRPVFKQLASLYLKLSREKDAAGNIAAKPSGSVDLAEGGKSRLRTRVNGEWVPILPPRLPVATPDSIRGYIVKPPDYAALKPEERNPERPLTDDQRMQLRIQAAQTEADVERLKIERLQAERYGGQTITQQVPLQLPSSDGMAAGTGASDPSQGSAAPAPSPAPTGQVGAGDGHPPATPGQPVAAPTSPPADSAAPADEHADEKTERKEKAALREKITTAAQALGLPANKIGPHIQAIVREINAGVDAAIGKLGSKKLALILAKLDPNAPQPTPAVTPGVEQSLATIPMTADVAAGNQTLQEAMAAQPTPARHPPEELLTSTQLYHEFLVVNPLPEPGMQDAMWAKLKEKFGVNGQATTDQEMAMRRFLVTKIREVCVARQLYCPF